ncbi:hypothetical protein [Streptomyces sp. MAR4 CNX-425]|uniref:hypothetical protein n=1 Tax=Streptomyces sp. MAR4 CNX-425 TaxID=3406343 RepID=UPI003B50BF7A
MKKLTKILDLPLVQRFLGNRWAIGAACALMVVTGVVAAMLTAGGPEPASDAKPSVRDEAAQGAKPGKQANQKEAAAGGQRQDSAKAGGRAPANSAGKHHPQRRPSHGGPRLGTSFDNGTVFVGGAVAPGTYATQGSNGDPGGCEWSRLADNGGELVPIMSGSTWGPAHLTVHDGEYVRSSGCQTWKRTHSTGTHK